MNAFHRATLTLAFGATLAALAAADGRNPGSLLLFPEFDHSQGHNTLVTVTNTNLDSGLGTVRVHYQYVSGVTGQTLCTEADRIEILTPGDTITVLTSLHNPGAFNRGFLYVYAVDSASRPVSFNYLAGDVVQVDAANSLQYAVNPLPFFAVAPQGNLTDVDNDGIRDFDGVEYEQAPNRILIPRFMGQSATYTDDLVLIALTGGKQFTTLLDFLLYNDNEEIFSGQHSFKCWKKVNLLSVNAAFANSFLHDFTNDAPSEILGAPTQEAGWISINGNMAWSTNTAIQDPAFLAVLVERAGGPNKAAAELPFFDGRQANGSLLPTTLDGLH